MGKRNYTHVQVLLPEINAMLAEGKTQREAAEYYGFEDKQVVKGLLGRERRKERRLAAGILPRPTMPHQEALWQSRRMRPSACRWKANYCGLFCTSQEGGEGEGKIPHPISSQNRVSRVSHVQILFRIQKRLRCPCPPSGQAGEGCRPCRAHRTAAETRLRHLWLPADVAVAEKPEYFP